MTGTMAMNKYRITVTITQQTTALDAGGWQMAMSWRKSLILDPDDNDQARRLRDQANAAGYADDLQGMQDLNRQAQTMVRDEWERLRDHVRTLVAILNAPKPATHADGTPMWDRGYAMSNRKCWQWELAMANPGNVCDIMRAAGIDDWPPADSMPDILNPEVTINLSIID